MRRLFGYFALYRRRYAFGIFCLAVTASLAMLVPYLLKQAVNTVAELATLGVDATGGRGPGTVAGYAGLIVVVAVVQGVVRTFSRFVVFNAGRDIEYALRNDLFAHLQRLPLSFYQRRQTGDLMSRLVNDITAVRLLLGPGILSVINTPIYYVYGVAIMLSMDPGLTVAALAPYPLLFLLVKRYSRVFMERALDVQAGLADMSSHVQESLSGIQVIKAYGREEALTAAFGRINETFAARSLELARIRGVMFPVMRMVGGIGALMVLWVGGWHVITGQIGLGHLVAFFGYLYLLAWPTMALGWMLSVIQRGRAAMQRLEELFSIAPDITEPAEPEPLETVRGELVFRGVRFGYPGRDGRERVLRGVDVRVPPGARVAIVGRTGAGKSTLVQLIPRLFDVEAGAVLLDGHDVRRLSLDALRRAIAFVPQDPFLFSDTVAANVAFGLEDGGSGGNGAAEELIRDAVMAAGLGPDLATFPRGLDTLVGERGLALSGGQKQRLTIARALVADRPVLVLDDALSSVDTETEGRILAALRERLRGRTQVLISHRISAVKDADVIVVLDDGVVVEAGDHQTLLARRGVYAELFRRQGIEQELATL